MSWLVLPASMGDFGRDTAVSAVGDGLFGCEISPDWWVAAGPNGGYIAAIVVRALSADPELDGRPLRSITLHYQRPPRAGPAEVHVEVDRHGRSVSFMRARLVQEGRTCASAQAVFAIDRGGIEYERVQPPSAPPPERVDQAPQRVGAPPFSGEFDFRPALGEGVFASAEEALTGGWLRFRDERPLDSAALVALCDAWFPAIFSVSAEPLAVPTLELTVHLRAPLPRPHDWVLGRFSTGLARNGFLEEDAEIFTREGELLAQSRQLALAG